MSECVDRRAVNRNNDIACSKACIIRCRTRNDLRRNRRINVWPLHHHRVITALNGIVQVLLLGQRLGTAPIVPFPTETKATLASLRAAWSPG